jgi:hypothetical protein
MLFKTMEFIGGDEAELRAIFRQVDSLDEFGIAAVRAFADDVRNEADLVGMAGRSAAGRVAGDPGTATAGHSSAGTTRGPSSDPSIGDQRGPSNRGVSRKAPSAGSQFAASSGSLGRSCRA